MDRDLRASLIASGGAAILSLLVGLLSGVGVLALVVRAILGGLVFGGLVFGALALVGRFLPELLEGEEGAVPVDQDPPPGAAVDIVLDGEGTETLYGPGEDGTYAGQPGAFAGPRSEAASRRQTIGAGDGVDASAEGVSDLEDADLSGESLLEDAPPVRSPQAAPRDVRPALGRPSDGLDELDILPDLDSYSGSFNAASLESDGFASDPEEASPAAPTGGGGHSDADPMVLAQAVRTLLKRDQER